MPYTLRRQAARVIVFEPAGRFLVLRAADPVVRDGGHWWEIPGGGIDPGESSEDAARRELREEAGITDAEIGPCVFTQHARFTFAGLHFDQHERIHLAWCDAPTDVWDPHGLESLEALAFQGQAWWSIDDLTGTAERVLPARLRQALPDLLARPLPTTPIDITPSIGAGLEADPDMDHLL
jgi:8-oxo-dGTP pyrophosphatase MutT (NUDIX family)